MMAKVKTVCPRCGRSLQYEPRHRGKTVKCLVCGNPITLPDAPRRKFVVYPAVLAAIAVVVALTGAWSVWPSHFRWPDRRPIGVLDLASDYFSSPTNPRGWFNDKTLDVTGPGGPQRFRKALDDYTDRSIAVLKRAGAQGVIVWDLEGEQYPHKITYIGDPRLLGRLAPEMDLAADEFFRRLRNAGFRVGVTIRPQQLVFGDDGQPRQKNVLDINKLLLEKIDYARARWGATLFYVDSNDGFFRPDEIWQLRRVAEERPDILLIPEHHSLFYRAFSAPFEGLARGGSPETSVWARRLFPGSFQSLYIADATNDPDIIALAQWQGDVLLFRAWYWNPDCTLLERVGNLHPTAP